MLINIIIAVIALSIIGYLIYRIKTETDHSYFIEHSYKQDIKRLKNSTEAEKGKLLEKLTAEQSKSEALEKQIASTKCILCNAPSKGKHFCYSCYTKFKDHSVDVRIEKCANSTILDPYGNKTFACDDGRMVRSRAEALISNFLFNNKIRYIYEKPVYHYVNDEIKTLHPDFYLPDYNLYIEYNELNTESYAKGKEYAMRIYRQKGLKVLVMTNKELHDISAFLSPRLNIN